MKKSNIIVVTLIFAFLSLWIFMGKGFQDPRESNSLKKTENLPSVVVENFKSIKKDVSLEYFGTVYLGRSYSFEAQYSDKINLKVKKGQSVKRGDILFSYQNNALNAQKQALSAELSRLNVEKKALESLRSKNFSSEVEYKTVLENIAKINSSIVSLDDEINRSTKRAPEDGVVEELYVENSQYVDNGALIMDFQASENKVVSNIDVIDIPKIKIGDEVDFLSNAQNYKGVVDFIGSNIGGDNAGAVIFEMNSSLKLPNGYPGELTIHVEEKEILNIPIDAALLKGKELGVYHIVEEKAQFQPIEVYKTEKDNLIIKSFGDNIDLVTLGQYLIDETGKVKVTNND